jgi:S1-C subfamily serine protease
MEASQTVSALVIEQEEDHMLMITDYGSISQTTGMTVSIGQKVLPAEVKSYDLITHLALIRVEITPDVSRSLYHQIRPAAFGSSEEISVGEMIMAAGSPIGYTGSFAYGNVTYIGEITNRWDAHYPLIYTDITGRDQPFGFLFSMEGKVVGYIDRSSFGSGTMGNLSGIGTERLMNLVGAMQQDRNFAYFGILGENVTDAMVRDQGLVKGIYINQTAQDSPAYLSALQAGDIITAIDGRHCQTMKQLMDQLLPHAPNDVVKVTYYRWSTGGGYQEMNTELILSGRFVFPEN